LDPATMQIVAGGIGAQTRRVFDNLQAVAAAAGGSLADFVKINIYLVDLAEFGTVNEIMAAYFSAPYPARACVQVAALPKGALVEVEGTLVLD
jgi:reactive intermediate/imine deaminase